MTKNWRNELDGKHTLADLLGESLNETDRYGNDAFLAAIKFGKNDLALDMLKNLPGLDLDKTDVFGRTALHKTSDSELAKLLLEKGADFEVADSLQNTPMLLATIYNRAEVVELLKDAGADLHHVNVQGQNLLHLAAYSGNLDLVEMALEAGVEQVDDKNGRSLETYYTMMQRHPHVGEFLKEWNDTHSGALAHDDVLGLDGHTELVEEVTTLTDDVA